MNLPIPLDYPPMEAQLVAKLPTDDGWQFEPKWDGFRCIVFKDSNTLELISKTGKPLTRYFPEVVASFSGLDVSDFVLDGEIVIARGKEFSFDDLLQRIHPAESRVRKLSVETPASFMAFDLLVVDGKNLTELPLTQRRGDLEAFADKHLKKHPGIQLCPFTDDREVAQDWLEQGFPQLDGVIAKRASLPYQSGNRKGMLKIKRIRSADCVIGGFRYAKDSEQIGSLLLGLYDENGDLHHVGYTSAFAKIDKAELTKRLEGLTVERSFTANSPGGPSRWNNERTGEWVPVNPELVLEIQYDHITNKRFRHGTSFMRWRPDKNPKQCTFEQIERVEPPTK